MGIDVGWARDAGEVVIEDVTGDLRGCVQGCVENVAGRRVDQAGGEIGFGDLLGDSPVSRATS